MQAIETLYKKDHLGRVMLFCKRCKEQYAPTWRLQAMVVRRTGVARALSMPPAVMAIIARIYGEGGWPARPATGGAAWGYIAPLCRGEISQIGVRQARLRIWMRSSRTLMLDCLMQFELDTNLARMLTAAQIAKAAELSEEDVRAAMLAEGVEVADWEAVNALAARALLIAYCRRQRDAHKGKSAAARRERAAWEERQMQIVRSSVKRWVK